MNADSTRIFFFFLISKNDIYTKGYSMHEEYRANLENTRWRKQNKNKKENQTTEKLQKRKGAKKRRERVTSRESPCPRPIKKSPTKRSKQLITGAIQVLKSPPIPLFQTQHRMPNGTKFQIWDECFPNRFHQPKSKSGIDLAKDKSKVLKIKVHNR